MVNKEKKGSPAVMILLLIETKQEDYQFSKIMVVSNGVSNFKRFRARLMLCYNKDCAYSLPPDGSAPRKKAGKKRGRYRRGAGAANEKRGQD